MYRAELTNAADVAEARNATTRACAGVAVLRVVAIGSDLDRGCAWFFVHPSSFIAHLCCEFLMPSEILYAPRPFSALCSRRFVNPRTRTWFAASWMAFFTIFTA